jgi:NAD-dependent deacetylase
MCEQGFQLRPDIVWFGEAVPAIEEAATLVASADIFVVIGTSMVVYPAAGLIDYVSNNTPVFLIDPNEVAAPVYRHIHFIKEKAGKGVEILKAKLLAEYL